MADEYNDNNCIELGFVDQECGGQHDIRPGGSDGSAHEDGVYGGADGSEPIALEKIEYMRQLPCGAIDIKAIRTLFYRLFKLIESICNQLADPCELIKDCNLGREVATIALVETGTNISSSIMSGSSGVGHIDDPNSVFSFSNGEITVARSGYVTITSQALAISNMGGFMDALILVNGDHTFQNAAASYPNSRIANPVVGEASIAVCSRKIDAGGVIRLGAAYTSGSGSGAWGEGTIQFIGE